MEKKMQDKYVTNNKDQFNILLNEAGFILKKCFGNYLL